MQEPSVVDSEPEGVSKTHIVHVLMQFALAVRYRKNVLIAAMLASGLLAGLHYATDTRYYSASASLEIRQPAVDVADDSATASTALRQGMMPTYERQITSDRVLEGAIPLIPRQDCIDLASRPRAQWAAALRENLSAQAIHMTSIVEIEYFSKDPRAAVSVINAVRQSYLDFMNQTHKGAAAESIDMLTRQKAEADVELHCKEAKLQEARQQAGVLDTGSESKLAHPLVQQSRDLAQALTETQKQRIAMEATLRAIDNSLRTGKGLEQHIMTVAEFVGKEFLLGSLGINPQASVTQSAMERDVLADQAKLETMESYLGPRNPQVLDLQQRIFQTQQYLAAYPELVRQKISEIQESRLGPMLKQMVEQKLDETSDREAALEAECERAEAATRQLSGHLAKIDGLEHVVARLRGWDDTLRDKLANIGSNQEGPGILVIPLNEPKEASSPVSPSALRHLLVAIVAGAAIGLLGVYVLDTLDDRFRSLEEMQGQLAAPVLALVGRLASQEGEGLQTLQICAQPDGAESEAFRTLRTALSLASAESARLVISSAEPGDGKTTVLANLAVACAQSGKRTLLIDADLRRPGLTNMLRLRGVGGLSNVIRSRDDVATLATAHIRSSGVSGLDVLPSGPRPTNPAELLAGARFSELLAWAETVYDHVLIDSPPALATSDTAVIGRLVDGVILVVQPEKNRRRSVLRAVESFLTLNITILGVVVNRVAGDRGSYYGYGESYGYRYDYKEDDRVDAQDELREGIVPRRAA